MIKFRAHNASVSEQLIYSPPESMHRWCFCEKKKKVVFYMSPGAALTWPSVCRLGQYCHRDVV